MAPGLKVEATSAVAPGLSSRDCGSLTPIPDRPVLLLHKKRTRFSPQSLPFTPRATGNTLPYTSMTILFLQYHYYYNALMHIMEPWGRLY